MPLLPFQSMEDVTESEIKAQISSHPLYPNLLSAYINCRKVGLPPEVASLFEEINMKTLPSRGGCSEIGDDPELDDFMETFCKFLQRYKEELSNPFDEATSFLSDMKSQLSHLCKETFTSGSGSGSGNCHSDEAADSRQEDVSCGEIETVESQDSTGDCSGDQALKEMLLRKYSGYISCLRNGFLNQKKRGKLPRDARAFLLDWWNTNYRWPYPTEEENVKLAEISGLEHKQINNWFINQRKRHWTPSEDMSNGSRITEPTCFDNTTGGTGSTDFYST